MHASNYGHVGVVRLLLRCMVARGLDERTRDGSTALYIACYNGYADVVRAQPLAGLDITIAHNNGPTPLRIAQTRHHHQCVAVIQVSTHLLSRGDTCIMMLYDICQ